MSLWKESVAVLKPHPRERLKFLLGTLLYPRATWMWLRFVRSKKILWDRLPAAPKLLTRIYRPYAFEPLKCQDRVELLLNHYRTLEVAGWSKLFNESVTQAIVLAEVPSKSGDLMVLSLLSLGEGHREGEMSLLLQWQGRVIFTVSFLLASSDHGFNMIITRLHGNRDHDGKEIIRQATKALHGLRPAVLITQLSRHLAMLLGCEDVLLVGNHQRVALNPKRRKKIKTDLDGLWIELGAVKKQSGFFHLHPRVHLPSDFSDVASHKRAEAKRKATILSCLLLSMDSTVGAYRDEAITFSLDASA